MDKLDKKDKILLSCLITLVIGAFIYKITMYFVSKQQEETFDNEIHLVTDASRFFTVSSCVDRFMKYISVKDNASVYKMVSSDYMKDNGITQSTVLSLFPSVDSGVAFSAIKMYEQQIGPTVMKYYIYGQYETINIDDISTQNDYYVIVYLYTKNMLFALEPYDGALFKE